MSGPKFYVKTELGYVNVGLGYVNTGLGLGENWDLAIVW